VEIAPAEAAGFDLQKRAIIGDGGKFEFLHLQLARVPALPNLSLYSFCISFLFPENNPVTRPGTNRMTGLLRVSSQYPKEIGRSMPITAEASFSR
jgi:hypothetical protein